MAPLVKDTETAQGLAFAWGAAWGAVAIASLASGLAALVLAVVACLIGAYAIGAAHRAIGVRAEFSGAPFIGPLELCSFDRELRGMRAPPPRLMPVVVALAFAPVWAFLPALIALATLVDFTGGDSWLRAQSSVVFWLFAASRIAIAFHLTRVLGRVESLARSEDRHASHVLPVGG